MSTDASAPIDRRRSFSASNAARFMACPASAHLELAIPGYVPPVVDPTKGAKGKGSAMHEYLEQTAQWSPKDLLHMSQALGYMAELRSKRRFKVLAEESTTADWLVSKPRTTVDVVLYTQDELHIVDWKWGAILVEAAGNEQLMFYAACFMGLAPKAKGVTVHIVQPTANNMQGVWISSQELAEFIRDAREAERKVLASDTTFGPSDHCTFCPANPHSRGDKGRPLCPAMLQLLYPSTVDEQAILDL